MSKKSLDKKKNNDYISYRSSKIVFCNDGRILLTDKDTEIVGLDKNGKEIFEGDVVKVYYTEIRDCENCKQKDQRIAELEKQLAIRDKALELAVREELNTYQFTLGAIVKTRCSEWLEQAEEALKKLKGE